MMLFTPLELFFWLWGAGLVGFIFGTAWRWLWTEMTDGELRLAHHVRETDRLDEHGEGL